MLAGSERLNGNRVTGHGASNHQYGRQKQQAACEIPPADDRLQRLRHRLAAFGRVGRAAEIAGAQLVAGGSMSYILIIMSRCSRALRLAA